MKMQFTEKETPRHAAKGEDNIKINTEVGCAMSSFVHQIYGKAFHCSSAGHEISCSMEQKPPLKPMLSHYQTCTHIHNIFSYTYFKEIISLIFNTPSRKPRNSSETSPQPGVGHSPACSSSWDRHSYNPAA
jgi:hypothetical protein